MCLSFICDGWCIIFFLCLLWSFSFIVHRCQLYILCHCWFHFLNPSLFIFYHKEYDCFTSSMTFFFIWITNFVFLWLDILFFHRWILLCLNIHSRWNWIENMWINCYFTLWIGVTFQILYFHQIFMFNWLRI